MASEQDEIEMENGQEYPSDLGTGIDPKRLETASRQHDFAERVARNQALGKGEEAEAEQEAWSRLVTEVTAQKSNCMSFAWGNSGAAGLLPRVVSARVSVATEHERNLVRGGCDRCMLCGRNEKNCDAIVELCGVCDDDEQPAGYDAREWLTSDHERLRKMAPDFFTRVDEVEARAIDVDGDGGGVPDRLPPEYLGAFVVGESCLRWLLLHIAWQSIPLDLVFGAEYELEGQPTPKRGEIVTHDIRSHIEHERMMDTLRGLTGSDNAAKRPGNPVPWSRLWDPIDVLVKRFVDGYVAAHPRGHRQVAWSPRMVAATVARETALAIKGDRARAYLAAECDRSAPVFDRAMFLRPRKATKAASASRTTRHSSSQQQQRADAEKGAGSGGGKRKAVASEASGQPKGKQRAETGGGRRKRRIASESDDEEDDVVDTGDGGDRRSAAKHTSAASHSDDAMLSAMGDGPQEVMEVVEEEQQEATETNALGLMHELLMHLHGRGLHLEAQKLSVIQSEYLKLLTRPRA